MSKLSYLAPVLALSVAAGAAPVAAQDPQSGKAVTIGVLFPDSQTPTWEMRHWPSIRDTIMAACADCKVLYGNTAGDPTEQRNQADSMMAQGANALVIAPVNGSAAGVIVNDAKARGIPVIAYGSIMDGPVTAFVGVDVIELGRVQGAALLAAVKAGGDPKRGCVVALNGDSQNHATDDILKGRRETLDGSVDICKEYWTPNWSPANAQSELDQAITTLGRDKIIGVYAMNDGIASGASAALKGAGFEAPLPAISGMDADLAALQRTLVGEQAFSVSQQPATWGKVAGPVALAAARGEELKAEKTETNGEFTFPWFPTPPLAVVTKDTIQKDVIDAGYVKASELCVGIYADACKTAGIR